MLRVKPFQHQSSTNCKAESRLPVLNLQVSETIVVTQCKTLQLQQEPNSFAKILVNQLRTLTSLCLVQLSKLLSQRMIPLLWVVVELKPKSKSVLIQLLLVQKQSLLNMIERSFKNVWADSQVVLRLSRLVVLQKQKLVN